MFLFFTCPSYTCYRLKKCVQCNKKVFTKKSQCICNVLKVKDGTEGESKHFKFMTKSYRIGTYAVHETSNLTNISLEYIMYILSNNISKMLKLEYYFHLNIRNDESLKYRLCNMSVLCQHLEYQKYLL